MVQHRVGQAPLVMGRRQRQERRLATGELEEGGTGHGNHALIRRPGPASARSMRDSA